MKHIKLVSLTSILFVTLIIAIIACNKNVRTSQATKEIDRNAVSNINESNYKKTKISCSGSCTGGCHLEGLIAADPARSYTQCSCGECEMEVEYTENGVVTNTTLPDGEVDIKFLQGFQDFMEEEYPNEAYTITEISIHQYENSDYYGIQYVYNVDNVEGTITFVDNPYMQAEEQKKTRVDCHATQCDCRERFIPSTGAIECTCQADCVMDVTSLSSNL